MIKSTLRLFAACFGLVFFFGCDSKPSKNTLVIGTSAAYYPYEFRGSDNELTGFDVAFGKALAKQLHREAVFKDMNFDALILALKQNKIDLILSGMSITPSREKEIAMVPYHSTPTTQLILAFWEKIPEGIFSINDFSHHPEMEIAVQVGTFQADYLLSLSNVHSKTLESNTELLIDLKYQKSTAVLLEPFIASALKSKFPQLTFLPVDLPKNHWIKGNGIGIATSNTLLKEKIQHALEDLERENALSHLEKIWLGGKS